MPRKPKDIVPIMLRIREHLRRRLESEAKKRAYSLNYEIARRLEDSFERGDVYTIGGIAHDIGTNWAGGWAAALHKITAQNELRKATETLMDRIAPLLDCADAPERVAAEKAIEQVRLAINAIDTDTANAIRSVTTSGG